MAPYWKPTYSGTGEQLCFGKRSCTVFVTSGGDYRYVIEGRFSKMTCGDIEEAKSGDR
jgi:hypothetical protein